MSTDQKTRPPVWIRKFKSWADKQPRNEDDNIELGKNMDIAGTPWGDELTSCDIVKIDYILYHQSSGSLFIALRGRKLDDHEIIKLPSGGDYAVDTWPEFWHATYFLDEMPPGGKRFLTELIGRRG